MGDLKMCTRIPAFKEFYSLVGGIEEHQEHSPHEISDIMESVPHMNIGEGHHTRLMSHSVRGNHIQLGIIRKGSLEKVASELGFEKPEGFWQTGMWRMGIAGGENSVGQSMAMGKLVACLGREQ